MAARTKAIAKGDLPKLAKSAPKAKQAKAADQLNCELTMTAEMGRQLVLRTQPKLKPLMEATELVSLRQRKFQVLACPKPNCQGNFLFVGRTKLPGGRLSAGGLRICSACGHHERSLF